MRLTDKRLHSKSGIHNTPVSFTPPRRGQSHFPSTGMESPLGITTGSSKGVLFLYSSKLVRKVMCSVQPESTIQSLSFFLSVMFALCVTPSLLLVGMKCFTRIWYCSFVSSSIGLASSSVQAVVVLPFTPFFPGHQSGYPMSLKHPSHLSPLFPQKVHCSFSFFSLFSLFGF